MKLLEIKNNLIKLSYGEGEVPVLGRFIVLVSDVKSYVAQLVNLKSDSVNNFAIAKLLFTFTTDGVVDNYDGSVPSMASEISFLSPDELLDLLPVETPVKFGTLAQQKELLNLDISIFEHNFTAFVERDIDKSTFISNCVRQLFQMKEKSVIIDTDNLFEDYPKIKFGVDFKLPLNSEMIDYIFEYELSELDAPTKAIVQDIFCAVQQYIKSLDFEFLPIDNFVDVVAGQYKDTQMPELALLKNKLLKYRDANVFANTKNEVLAFAAKLNEKNCSIVDLKDINESLQCAVISFVHKALENLEKYVYFFVPLNDGNSDKKLLKRFINHNHVFTTILTSHSYKYARALKAHAENMMIFAPQTLQHDFATYNTFLNKLNLGECIVYGKLTQGIPFIIDMSDLSLDLTKDDVLGDKYHFVPIIENKELVAVNEEQLEINTANVNYQLDNIAVAEPVVEPEPVEVVSQISSSIPELEQPPVMIEEEELPVAQPVSEQYVEPEMPSVELEESYVEEIVDVADDTEVELSPVQDYQEEEVLEREDLPSIESEEPVVEEIYEPTIPNVLEDSGIMDNIVEEPSLNEEEEDIYITDFPTFQSAPIENSIDFDNVEEELTEDDLNFIENSQSFQDGMISEPLSDMSISDNYVEEPYINEQSSVVPVFAADTDFPQADSDEIAFVQGDSVSHPRYGRGVVEKIIKYGNKTLCSISFENVGRRLLDPTISEFEKI